MNISIAFGKSGHSFLAGVIVASAWLTGCGTSKVKIGKDEVGYAGKATKEEAKALGEAMKAGNYFQDRGVTVLLTKDNKGTTISYAVKDGVWDDQDSVAQYGLLTTRVASTAGGLPITMRLVNVNFDTKREEVLHPKLKVGKAGEITYQEAATEADAKVLAEALKAAGYFSDADASVLLSKGKEGTVVSFVVQDGFWEAQKNVNLFADLGRTVAPALGGLPLKVRLMNTSLIMKKEIPLS
jgi:hypothetical protein